MAEHGPALAAGRDLRMQFGPVHALDGLDIEIHAGRATAILGPSGSGKSTLLNVLGLLEAPTSGSYELMGERADGLTDRRRTELRRRHLGFVFQAFHLIPHLTTLENVIIPLRLAGWSSRRAMGEQARQTLEDLGLGHRIDSRPGTLSGGERQRTAIARALVGDPQLLLCDEPTGNLDSATGARVMELLLAAGRGPERALVIVTHDPAVASLTDEQIRLIDGRLT